MKRETIQAQKSKTQKSLLVKKYLEQELEAQGCGGHVKYDRSNKSLIQFRIKEGTIAVMKNGKLDIFKMPVKKFHNSMPLEFESVDADSIKTEKATYCKKCKNWKRQANITHCSCGEYLISRERFHTKPVESWDAEFLETQFAKADIAAAVKTDRVLSRRVKQYRATGITSKLAGMSSVASENKPRIVTRVSESGVMWLESFGESMLAEIANIKKMDGFAVPSNSVIQHTIREQLCQKFLCEMTN